MEQDTTELVLSVREKRILKSESARAKRQKNREISSKKLRKVILEEESLMKKNKE